VIESTVGTENVPESVRALGSLPGIDYADLFTLRTLAEATPERWARAMFGNVPSPAERIRLETASAALSCNLVVQTGDGRVSLATFLHYDRRRGRARWRALSSIHRRLVPGVLRDAATRAARPRDAQARRCSTEPRVRSG
jgi:hypothetical protein